MNYSIFILTIRRNQKRYEYLQQQLINEGYDSNNINLFFGIDYQKSTPQEIDSIRSKYAIITPSSVLCCAASHVLLWKHISSLKNKIDYAVVVEDDSCFIKERFDFYRERIEKQISDTRFLNFSKGLRIASNYIDEEKLFIKSHMVLSLDSYLLTPALAEKMFMHYKINGLSYHIDLHLGFVKDIIGFEIIHFDKHITKCDLRTESSMVSGHKKKFVLGLLKNTETYKELNTPICEFNRLTVTGYLLIVFVYFIVILYLTQLTTLKDISIYCFLYVCFLWFVLGMLIYDLL